MINIKSLNIYAEKILLAAYAIFLVSISLELEVNLFRTILLCAFINFGFFNQATIKELFSSNFVKISLIFPCIALIAWTISPYEANGLKTFDWIIYILIGLITTFLWKEKSILFLLIIPITCITASAITLLWVYINSLDYSYILTKNNRLILYIGSFNRLGLLCALAAAICIGTTFLQKRWAIPLTLLALSLSYINWLTQSRGSVFAVFGVICLSMAYAFHQNKRSPVALSLLGLFVTLLVVGTFFVKGRILSTLTSFDFAFLLNGRDDIWLAAWEIFQKSPLVGHGVDSFHGALRAHLTLPENLGRFPAIRGQYTFFNAHQMILGILCETGIAGLAVFSVLIFRGIGSAIRNLPQTLPPFLMLTAFLIHGIGGYGFHRSWNAALFFLPLGILEGWRMVVATRSPANEPGKPTSGKNT